MSNGWLIVAMMAVTFIPRYLPFALAGRIRLPALLVKALSYVPIAILTAIVTLNSVVRENQIQLDLDNHHLIAAVVAALVAYFSRRMGLTVVVGLFVFAALTWWPSVV